MVSIPVGWASVENETTPCFALRAQWVLVPVTDLGVALRLSQDPTGTQLWLTREEEALREVDRLRALLEKGE